MALAVAATAAVLVTAPSRAADGRERGPIQPVPAPVHAPPVDAPIADPFRPPAGPYGSGNRGLDYDTTPGDVVRASAAGTVVFAGPVAGALHVTVRHADGVRTSYSFLQDVSTTVGATVAAGDAVGTAGEHLHFGARVGDAYFDPAALFSGTATVELLPFEVPPGSTPDAEARALAVVALADGRGLSLGDLGPTIGWLRDRVVDGSAVLAGGPGFAGASTLGRGLSVASDLVDRLVFPPPCSGDPPPARPLAGERRVAVTVAGLGSTSESAAIDDLRTADLGYDPGRVVRFSYAGGRTPGSGATLVALPTSRYTSADTQADVVGAAARLADLVEQVAETDPGARVDLYGHSLGGLVTRLALVELQRRGFPLSRLGLVATIASPHRGADLATAVAVAADAPRAGPALDLAADVFDLGPRPRCARRHPAERAVRARRRAGRRRPARGGHVPVDRGPWRPRGRLTAHAGRRRRRGHGAGRRAVGAQRRGGLRRGHGRDRPCARRSAGRLRGVGRRRRRRRHRSHHLGRRGPARPRPAGSRVTPAAGGPEVRGPAGSR